MMMIKRMTGGGATGATVVIGGDLGSGGGVTEAMDVVDGGISSVKFDGSATGAMDMTGGDKFAGGVEDVTGVEARVFVDDEDEDDDDDLSLCFRRFDTCKNQKEKFIDSTKIAQPHTYVHAYIHIQLPLTAFLCFLEKQRMVSPRRYDYSVLVGSSSSSSDGNTDHENVIPRKLLVFKVSDQRSVVSVMSLTLFKVSL